MPITRTVFEREIREISRIALKLEKLVAYSESIPSPVQYQQILRRVSELHQMWRDHLSNPYLQEPDGLGFTIEQQLKAVSGSSWPRSAHIGMHCIRVSVSGILKLVFPQLALERTRIAQVIHRRRSPLKPVEIQPVASAMMDADFHIRSLPDHRMNPKYLTATDRP